MTKRAFGNTGLEVTTLGYGAMELRRVDEAMAGRLLNEALDQGINFIDTAPDYGTSEDHIGATVSHRRDEFILASKCGCNIPRPEDEDAPGHIWTGDQVRHNVEMSLRRMRTDHLDILQIHSAYPEEIEGTDVLEAMGALKQEGRIRFIAYSAKQGDAPRYGHDQLTACINWPELEAVQLWYSALCRINEGIAGQMADKGLGTIVRGTVKCVVKDRDEAWRLAGLDDLIDTGQTREQFLLRFAISHRWLHTTIVGTKSLVHLKDNLAAAQSGPLPQETLTEAKQRLDSGGIRANEEPPVGH